MIFYDKDGLTNYLSWEELARMRDAAKAGEDASMGISVSAEATAG